MKCGRENGNLSNVCIINLVALESTTMHQVEQQLLVAGQIIGHKERPIAFVGQERQNLDK
jgi:hypothetical protein